MLPPFSAYKQIRVIHSEGLFHGIIFTVKQKHQMTGILRIVLTTENKALRR